MSTYTLRETDDEKIKALLLGKRIVTAETGTFKAKSAYGWDETASGRLVLDDRTEVFVIPNEGGCACSAGDYDLEHLATVDNIITDVRLAAESQPDEYGYEGPTSYRIYVFADNAEINAVQIDGDDGNGYYGTGYELFVVPPGATTDE